ncbi:MAG: helix-turn-helix transcriptional regulator [Clostridia bacterium]|nr:helix-turn-helix transcriptional regulator [Clostridia bacterium]
MFQAENLRHIRDRKDVTRKAVCEAVGVDGDTYVAWENGDAVPSKEQQEALADFFGVSVNSLHHQTAVFGNSNAYDSEKAREQRQEKQRMEDAVYCARAKRALVVLTIMEAVGLVASLFTDPIIGIFSAVLSAFFLIQLWLGKNWARILFSVFSALSFVGGVLDFATMAFATQPTRISVVVMVLSLVRLIYDGFIFCFLWFSESMKAYVRVNDGQ